MTLGPVPDGFPQWYGPLFGTVFRVCEPNQGCLRTVDAVGKGAVLLQTARKTDRLGRSDEKRVRVRQAALLAGGAATNSKGSAGVGRSIARSWSRTATLSVRRR